MKLGRCFRASCAKILGGELDGQSVCLMCARDKVAGFAVKTAAALSLKRAPQVSYQHWAGVFCLMA